MGGPAGPHFPGEKISFFTININLETSIPSKEKLLSQGLLLLSVYCLLVLAQELLPGLSPIAFLLQNISFPLALFVSLLSWALMIPVDRGGVATFKNHFFHTTNSLVALASMMVYPQTWRPRLCYVPLLYGAGYLVLEGALQANGGFALSFNTL